MVKEGEVFVQLLAPNEKQPVVSKPKTPSRQHGR